MLLCISDHSPKSKGKKDLQCLFSFDKLDLYSGVDWRREYRAPTDFGFALKYPQVQKKSSKYIKFVCCDTESEMRRWMAGIRIAKFGKQLLENYRQTLELVRAYGETGRLPAVANRRLSTSASNGSIRPRSGLSAASSATQVQTQRG